jgi:hypothetical protein
VFTLQAILFYIPRWLWRNWEGGKLQALSKDLRVGFLSKEQKAEKKDLLLDYLQENLNNHSWWAGRYMLCEVLALINVIGAFTVPTPSQLSSLHTCSVKGPVYIQSNPSKQYNY